MEVKSKFQLFRESKNETRKQLAEGLAAFNEDVEYMERRIRDWENGNSKPIIIERLKLRNHYNISLEKVFSLFENKRTSSEYNEINELLEFFWNITSFDEFFSMINAFAELKRSGFITDKTGVRLFPFSRIQTDEDYDCSCIIFSDIHNQRVLLTESNTVAITPRNLSNGHFTFSLTVNYPVFSIEEAGSQIEFRQDIILTIFESF